MCRDQEKNKRLPSTSDDQSNKDAKVQPINDSICDVTQDLDNSSDEEDEKVGVLMVEQEDEDEEGDN